MNPHCLPFAIGADAQRSTRGSNRKHSRFLKGPLYKTGFNCTITEGMIKQMQITQCVYRDPTS